MSVAGLKRTGKSCRLRWVNYLHPGLKHGRLTSDEELLVLQLHAKWGNRWSRIAGCLPGRTDNEIKNYWRTHMRKKAQERRMNSSSSSSSSSLMNEDGLKGYSMDQIWDEIAASELSIEDGACSMACPPMNSDSLWKVEDDEFKISIGIDMIPNFNCSEQSI
ncbi:hypothetical protein Cni_G13486 [Canna indica]|uniref:Uncharacterized protein n=1 Tax=Canna indica TaxID=4628 RepID=A0AAQ3K9Z4_9LILI|nr:hypothetical protein Cni_G13486 [Canna indica]